MQPKRFILLQGGVEMSNRAVATTQPQKPQIDITKASQFCDNPDALSQYLQAGQFKDDIQPYFLSLARENPELEAFHFVEFLQKCCLTGADPRRNQAYLVPRQKKVWRENFNGREEVWVTIATTIFAYQFFIAKAQESGDYEGFSTETIRASYYNPFTGKEFQTLCSLTTVKRKGFEPYTYRAWLPEFMQTDREGRPTKAWNSKPYLMLEKCSIANAFRLMWPETMGGMYISEEMQGEESRSASFTELPKPKAVAAIAMDKAVAAMDETRRLDEISNEMFDEQCRRGYESKDDPSWGTYGNHK